jgi:hypothetical protein
MTFNFGVLLWGINTDWGCLQINAEEYIWIWEIVVTQSGHHNVSVVTNTNSFCHVMLSRNTSCLLLSKHFWLNLQEWQLQFVGNNIINIHMSSNRIAYGPRVTDVESFTYGNNTEGKCKYSSRLMVGSCHSVWLQPHHRINHTDVF